MQNAEVEKQDVDKIKKIMTEVDAIIELGIKIGQDGVNKSDLAHVPAVIEKVKALIELAPHFEEAKAEFKDIDANEVGELLIHAWSEFQDKA
jgi:hypothetical protein